MVNWLVVIVHQSSGPTAPKTGSTQFLHKVLLPSISLLARLLPCLLCDDLLCFCLFGSSSYFSLSYCCEQPDHDTETVTDDVQPGIIWSKESRIVPGAFKILILRYSRGWLTMVRLSFSFVFSSVLQSSTKGWSFQHSVIGAVHRITAILADSTLEEETTPGGVVNSMANGIDRYFQLLLLPAVLCMPTWTGNLQVQHSHSVLVWCIYHLQDNIQGNHLPWKGQSGDPHVRKLLALLAWLAATVQSCPQRPFELH